MSSLEQPVVSIDKDDTILGKVYDPDEGVSISKPFEGSHAFLEKQRALQRRCVIATAADERLARLQLAEFGISKLLQSDVADVYGLKNLCSIECEYPGDYGETVRLGRWFVHSESGLPLSSNRMNGSLPEGYDRFLSGGGDGAFKDLTLLRAHLAGHGGKDLRMVHISDPVDLAYMKNDTSTVMVCVEKDGRWFTRSRVDQVLDNLLGDLQVPPGTVFDTVFADGQPCQLDVVELARRDMRYARSAVCTIGERSFTLGRGKFGERIIYEK